MNWIKKIRSSNIMDNRNSVTGFSMNSQTTIKQNIGGAFVALMLICTMVFAEKTEAQTPAPQQSGPIALVGGTIHTVSNGVIEEGTILFEAGVITEIGQWVDLPEGTEEVDVSGKEIYPGFIDSYSRMGIYEIGAVNMTVDINEQGRINPNVRPEVGVNPESRHIGTARTAGVLTAVTTPGGGLISGQSTAMMLDGWSWEDMVLKSGTGLIVQWPSTGDEEEYDEELLELRDAFDDARSYYQARKAMVDGNGSRIDMDTRWEAMIPVFNGYRPVVVEANELRQIQDAITWAEEEEVELVIMGGRDAHYISGHLERKDIPVIVTSVLTSPNRAWEGYDGRYSLPSKLYDAGVTFAIAGGSSAPYAFRLPWEAGASAAYGLDADQALRAVTLSPAEILGIDDRVGSLETGKDATLLITTGNPMEYSTQVEQAYIEGRKIDMNDDHRNLYKKYREKVDQRNSQ